MLVFARFTLARVILAEQDVRPESGAAVASAKPYNTEMCAITKSDVLDFLSDFRENFLFAFMFLEAAPPKWWEPVLDGTVEYPDTPPQSVLDGYQALATRLSNSEVYDEVEFRFRISLLRTFIGDSHEVIDKYCQRHGGWDVCRSQDCFRFSSYFRHSARHAFWGEPFWPDGWAKLGITSISFEDRTIEMGTLTGEVSTNTNLALRLHDAMRDFFRNCSAIS